MGNAICEVTGYGKMCKCKTGYVGNGKNCHPNPCSYCHKNAGCYNGICKCKSGYAGNGKDCKKIDPCAKCSEYATCRTSYSGGICSCKDGYEGDGETCTKKPDPCEKCSDYANCVTKGYPPTKMCVCKTGYDGDGWYCEKEDPCDKCPNDTYCKNGKCICKDNGYNYGNNKCNDKNECASEYTNNCSKYATCTNTAGGFRCKCNAGFIGDGVTCQKEADPCDLCDKYAECVDNGYTRKCVCKPGYNGNGQNCGREDYVYPTKNPYPTGKNVNIYTKLVDGECSVMGFDWENEIKLLNTMKWSTNPTLYSKLVTQIMDEFASLGKAVLARSVDQCIVEKAGAVPCKLLYFPHTEHRCQLIERLRKVYTNVSEYCNEDWKKTFGAKMNTLLQNNKLYKGGAPCPKVNYL